MKTRQIAPLFALCAVIPLTAVAAEDGPTPWQQSADVKVDLEAYTQSNPPELPVSDDARPQELGDKMVFVNFDGANMNGGCGNSPQNNCSTIFQGTVNPYPGDAGARASIVQVMRQKTEAFGISVTGARPGSGDYDMEMVGTWAGVNPGGAAGVAPGIDCWDSKGGETSFTMSVGGNADAISEIILQEIAHTWGLAHINEQQDLLYPTTQGSGKVFMDQCIQIVSDTNLTPSSSGCSHHTQACGSNSQQNSFQELLLIFGPGTADTSAPILTIIAPTEGEMFPSGSDVDLIIGLDDDQDPMLFTTKVTLTGDAIGNPVETTADYAGPAEYTFPLKGLPDGSYTLNVDVSDESDNPANAGVVNFVVGNAGGTSAGTTTDATATATTGETSAGTSDSSTDGSGTDGSGSATGASATGTTAGETGGMDADADGCACSSDANDPGRKLAFLALPILAFLRRRH